MKDFDKFIAAMGADHDLSAVKHIELDADVAAKVVSLTRETFLGIEAAEFIKQMASADFVAFEIGEGDVQIASLEGNAADIDAVGSDFGDDAAEHHKQGHDDAEENPGANEGNLGGLGKVAGPMRQPAFQDHLPGQDGQYDDGDPKKSVPQSLHFAKDGLPIGYFSFIH